LILYLTKTLQHFIMVRSFCLYRLSVAQSSALVPQAFFLDPLSLVLSFVQCQALTPF
jgi:hypothetical protein